MRARPVELQPAREFVQRMHALETELERARHERRRLGNGAGSANRWGLDQPVPAEHEDGWFLTYLDMMTLLLVAMIVMLAFAGTMNRKNRAEAPADRAPVIASAAGPDSPAIRPAGSHTIPAPEVPAPYPAAPAAEFALTEGAQSAQGPLAGTFPPLDAGTPPAAPRAAAGETRTENPPVIPETTAASAGQKLPATGPEPLSPPRPSPLVAADAPQPSGAPPEARLPDTTAQLAPAASLDAAKTPAVAEKTVDAASEGASLAAALPLNELGSEVEVIINKRTVSLRVNSEILFDTGQADLSRHGLSVLKRLAQVLTKKGYDLTVEGHTDSVPVRSSSRYPSNWELSSARASSVVRYLQTNGIDKAHLKAVGYADTRPIGDNGDPDGRARNRRVELMIEKVAASDKPAPRKENPGAG